MKLDVPSLQDACNEWTLFNIHSSSAWRILRDVIRDERHLKALLEKTQNPLLQTTLHPSLNKDMQPLQQPHQHRLVQLSRLQEIKKKCLELFKTMPALMKLKESTELAAISYNAVLEVVKLETLPIGEEQVFAFVKKFIEAKKDFSGQWKEEDGENSNDILRYVRFAHFSPSFFYSEVVSSGLFSAQDLASLCKSFASSTAVVSVGDALRLSEESKNVGVCAEFLLLKRQMTPFVMLLEDAEDESKAPLAVGFFREEKIGDLKSRIAQIMNPREGVHDFTLLPHNGDQLSKSTAVEEGGEEEEKNLDLTATCGEVLQIGSFLKTVAVLELHFVKIGDLRQLHLDNRANGDVASIVLTVKETSTFSQIQKVIQGKLFPDADSDIIFLREYRYLNPTERPKDVGLKTGDVIDFLVDHEKKCDQAAISAHISFIGDNTVNDASQGEKSNMASNLDVIVKTDENLEAIPVVSVEPFSNDRSQSTAYSQLERQKSMSIADVDDAVIEAFLSPQMAPEVPVSSQNLTTGSVSNMTPETAPSMEEVFVSDEEEEAKSQPKPVIKRKRGRRREKKRKGNGADGVNDDIDDSHVPQENEDDADEADIQNDVDKDHDEDEDAKEFDESTESVVPKSKPLNQINELPQVKEEWRKIASKPARVFVSQPVDDSKIKVNSPSSTANHRLFKTRFCNHFKNGVLCPDGRDKCQFAHGEKELIKLDTPDAGITKAVSCINLKDSTDVDNASSSSRDTSTGRQSYSQCSQKSELSAFGAHHGVADEIFEPDFDISDWEWQSVEKKRNGGKKSLSAIVDANLASSVNLGRSASPKPTKNITAKSKKNKKSIPLLDGTSGATGALADPSSSASPSQHPLFKSELCHFHQNGVSCPNGGAAKCPFAHGKQELRQPPPKPGKGKKKTLSSASSSSTGNLVARDEDPSDDVCFPFFFNGKCERKACPYVHEKPGVCYQFRDTGKCRRVKCPFNHAKESKAK